MSKFQYLSGEEMPPIEKPIFQNLKVEGNVRRAPDDEQMILNVTLRAREPFEFLRVDQNQNLILPLRTEFNGPSDFYGPSSFRSSAQFHRNVMFNSSATFSSDAMFYSSASFNNGASFNGMVNFNGPASFNNGLTLNGRTLTSSQVNRLFELLGN